MAFYVLGILFISFLSVLSFSKFNFTTSTTNSNLIPGSCFALFAIYILYYVLALPKIHIYTDKIVLHQFLGIVKKDVLRSEINSWTTREKESKYGNYEYLYLTLNENKIVKLNSFEYANFEEVKWAIIKNKPQNTILKDKLDRKEIIKLSIILLFLSILFIYIASQYYKDESLTKNDIQLIKGKLTEDIELKRGKKSKSLLIKLENYSDFEFKIGSLALKETAYDDLMNDIKKGDSIYLSIEKEEYLAKVNQTRQLNFRDKYFFDNTIFVVEVRSKGFAYLSSADFNKVHRNNDYWGMGFFGIFGILLLITGIYIYPKDTKDLLLTKKSHQ